MNHMCPLEAPSALDMVDRRRVRKVTAEQSGRVVYQVFSRPIVREAKHPVEAGDGDDEEETLTQFVARAETKVMVMLQEFELPSVTALCFGLDRCTCGAATDRVVCHPQSTTTSIASNNTTVVVDLIFWLVGSASTCWPR